MNTSVKGAKQRDDDSFDLWALCWRVNSYFVVKFDQASACLKCGKDIPRSSTRRSNLISSAVVSSCSHSRNGFLCGFCDQETLFRITNANQLCFEGSCEEPLSIDTNVIKERLKKDVKLQERYLDALNAKSIDCEICAHFKPRPKRGVTLACAHQPSTCSDCIRQIIEIAISEGQWQNLKCPDIGCGKMLREEDIRTFGSPELATRYAKHIFSQCLNEMPDFRYCLSSGCNWGQVHSQGDRYPKVICLKCGAESCFSCQVPWHRRQTCAQYLAGAEVDQMSEEYMKKYCKRCPRRDCGIYIEKNGLCPDMFCTNCNRNFCWECKLIKGTGHLSTCRVYPGEAPKPSESDMRYREDWDEDPGYEGTAHEYSGYWQIYQRRN